MQITHQPKDSGYIVVTTEGTVLHKPDPANPDFATKCGKHGRIYAWMGAAPKHAICTDGC